jgi:GNAT superfamily N-acetyltransferase
MTVYSQSQPPLTVTDDKSKIDFELVHGVLSKTYWAPNIPRDTMQRAIDGSMCFSLFKDGRQIGFARVITDRATFAYLADVFVLEADRGRGAGTFFMGAVFGHPDLQGLRRFMLATRDAHALYKKFGFAAPARPEMLMEIVKSPTDLYVLK